MAKLTLSVDEKVVGRAKKYATRRGTSVSRLVEQYLRVLAERSDTERSGMPPVLARWRGLLKGSRIGVQDYRRYLERKYR